MSYLRLYRGSAREVAIAVFSGIAQSLVLIPIVFLVRVAFDELIPARDLFGLATIGVVMILLYLASGALLLWSRSLALRSTRLAIQRLRERLVTKIQRLPRERFVSDEAGHIHSLLVHDSERVNIASGALVGQLLPAVVFSFALGAALLYMNWLLFLTVVAVVPVLTIAMRFVARRASMRVNEFRAAFERFSRGVLFHVERMDLVRSHSAEEMELARQSRQIETLGQASASVGLWAAAHTVAQETVTSVSWSLILVVGGVAVAANAMTIGDVLAFSVAAMMLKRSVNSLVSAIPPIVEGRASLAALDALAGEPDDDAYSGTRSVSLPAELALDKVGFSYGSQPLLDGVELFLRPAEVTVVTGPSGSGKTTLLHLVLGYYRPQSGAIRVNGVAYDELDVRLLRRYIGFVPQDPVVFAGSVLENLAYGADEVDMQRVAEAAATAGADEFIGRLRDGYQTLVGEGGALLSGGQRQRLGLARALYRRPQVLLLDEPTNQLDERLAAHLVGNLRTLPWRPAVLIVSHELNRVAANADFLFELRDGQLEPRALPGERLSEAVA